MSAEDKQLYDAAYFGRTAKLETLLGEKADPNYKNIGWDTPLMMAAKNGKAECVKLLLAAGADPTMQNKDHETACSMATQKMNEAKSDPQREKYAGIAALTKKS